MSDVPEIGELKMDDEEEIKTEHVPEVTMFSTPGEMSDVTLVVEGRQLHVSRCVLSIASPVFRKMLEGEHKDKKKLLLTDKKYDEMVELLLCIYPSTTKIITKKNLEMVLPLADEYGMASLKQRCEDILLEQLLHDQRYNDPSNKELVHFLYLADKYDFEVLLTASVEKGKSLAYEGKHGIKAVKEFDLLSDHAKFRILSARMSNLEIPIRQLLHSVKSVHRPQSISYQASGFNVGQTFAVQPPSNDDLSRKVELLSAHFHKDPTI